MAKGMSKEKTGTTPDSDDVVETKAYDDEVVSPEDVVETETNCGETVFQKALTALGITTEDVLVYKEYSPNSVVVLTTDGKKLLYGENPGSGHNFCNVCEEKPKKN